MLQSWSQSLGLLFLRVSFGLLMLGGHGIPKLMGYGELAKKFPSLLGLGSHIELMLAIFAEFFCSVLLILGIGTRLAVIPLIVTMVVAMTLAHGSDPWEAKEKAALFLAAYITIFICGPGAFSLDPILWKWRKRPAKS